MLVIDPEECIDCSLCVPECPVDAIVAEDDVPAGKEEMVKLNRDLAEQWPVINERKDPPPDAEDYRKRTNRANKYHLER